jgi:hypothetical protein
MTITTVHRAVRLGRTIAGAALAVSLLAPTLPAQQPNAVTPTLLRRLAEAVDGHRTGTPVWVVGDYGFPNRIHAVRPQRDSAVADSTRIAMERPATGPVGIFGPFVAPVDSIRPPPDPSDLLPPPRIELDFGWIVPGCVHDRQTSVMRALGFEVEAICGGQLLPLDDLVEMRLVQELRSGEIITTTLPTWVDALFLTMPAIDKFVVPYYARILGPEEASRMRMDIMRRLQ